MATDIPMVDAAPVAALGELPTSSVVEKWTAEELFSFRGIQNILQNDKNRKTFRNAEIAGEASLSDGDVRHYWSRECQLPLAPSGELARLAQIIKDTGKEESRGT